MFTRIRLKNFKAWEETEDVPLAPVTLFLGENSSGKSSILQSLLLMKQTIESSDRSIHLNLGGKENDYVELGTFSDVLYKAAKDNHFQIELDIKTHDTNRNVYFLSEYARDVRRSPVVSEAVFSSSETQDGEYKFLRGERGIYNLYTPDCQLVSKGKDLTPERTIYLSSAAREKLESLGFYDDFYKISSAINNEFKNISYLGPLRVKPKRGYYWNKITPGVIGNDGENAISFLFSSDTPTNGDGKNVIQSVSNWLNKMGVAEELRIKKKSGAYEVMIHRDGIASNILDVGIGVSQVLPVLVQAYFAPEGSTVILEEPEIHLHPKAQALLADLFLEVSKERNVQFLVETHSEHLFRRLQTRVAEQNASADDCALYFVEREGAEAKLKDLKLDQFGRVAEWPKNFFGDATGEVRSQAIESMRRMKEQRKK